MARCAVAFARARARPAHRWRLAKSVPYAGVIHFGWPRHNIEPQPFLYDALDRRSDEVIKLYEDRITDLVHKLDRETPG